MAAFSGTAFGQSIVEWYYTQSANTIRNISLGNPVTIHSGNDQPTPSDKGYVAIINVVNYTNGYSLKSFSPDIWSGKQWTGLEPLDRNNSQIGLSLNNQTPSYGNNLVQIDSGKVGLFLNTWNLTPPKPQLTSSLQFNRYFSPSRTIWSTSADDSMLCGNGIIDLHSWEGPMSQAMTTLSFPQKNSNNFFWLNT